MDVDVPLLPSPECTEARIDTVVEANPITRHTVDKALPFHNVGDGSSFRRYSDPEDTIDDGGFSRNVPGSAVTFVVWELDFQ